MDQLSSRRMPLMLNGQIQGASVALQNPQRSVSVEKYKNTLGGMGYAEFVLGITSVALGVAAFVIRAPLFSIILTPGIWCGAFLIVSGILGIKVAENPSRCMYNANMVLSILTSCAMAVQVIMSSLGAAFSWGNSVPTIFQGILAVLGFAGMIICIVHSAYCCAGVCCVQNEYQGIMMWDAQQCFGVQNTIQLSSGQFARIPSQGVPLQGYPYSTAVVVSPPIEAPDAHPQQLQASQSQVLYTATGPQTSVLIPNTQATNPVVNSENPPSYTEFTQ